MAAYSLPGLSADNKGITVTFVPDNAEIDAGDRYGDTKGKSYIFYGNQSDHIVSVGSSDELLDKLDFYNKHGVKIDTIYIVGHGSGDPKNPSVDVGTSKMMPNDFDISHYEKLLQDFKELRNDSDVDADDIAGYEKHIKDLTKKIEKLKNVSAVMSPNANLHIVSCSLLEGEKGKDFAANMGEVLLGKNGGTIHASPIDIEVDQMTGWLWQAVVSVIKGKNGFVPIGDYYSIANWEELKVSPINRKGPVQIPADGTVVTTATLTEGVRYTITITGTFIYDEGENGTKADAQYFEDDDYKWQPRDWVVIDGVVRRSDAANPEKNKYGFNI
jgi:hypothetical protein